MLAGSIRPVCWPCTSELHNNFLSNNIIFKFFIYLFYFILLLLFGGFKRKYHSTKIQVQHNQKKKIVVDKIKMKLAAIINTGTGSSSSSGFFFFFDSIASSPSRSRSQHQRYRRWGPVVVSSSSRTAEQEHYTVLGISPNASSSDVKRAYRLLARKVSPTLTPTP